MLRQSVCCIPSGVAERYPEDALLGELGIEAYAGIPLRDAAGLPIGLAVVMHDEPFTDVHGGDFFHAAVAWMADAGVTTGTTPTTFEP